ncbi:MAG: STAS domain-containing protein [Spirochaetia bacterium]|nr:STAS domain-containing protein [Spirochaetia bacterium]
MLIDYKEKENFLILYLQGRMDVKYSSDIESDLNNLINNNPKLGVLLNLEKVEYMSSSGLRLFVTLLRKLKEQNRKFRLCNLTPAVVKIFEVVELLDMFDIYGDEKEALNS